MSAALSIPQLAEHIRLTVRQAERLVTAPDFPAPCECSPRAGYRWQWQDVLEFLMRGPVQIPLDARRQQKRMPPWADLAAIAKVYAEAARLTAETGVPHHVDHEIPLKGRLVCGLHVAENLRPIPAMDNFRKGNRFACE